MLRKIAFSFLFITALTILSSFYTSHKVYNNTIKFPYKKQGLTDKEAAAHLLSRFTFGVTPSLIDDVVKEGLEQWFIHQLNADLPDNLLNEKLKVYDILNLNNKEIFEKYPRNNFVIKMAEEEGIITKEEVKATDNNDVKQKLQVYKKANGYLPPSNIMRQMVNQKIIRAIYTNNQLQEVMTDFWYNHFNISAAKNQCLTFIPVYENATIRKNSLGSFENLLIATAKSPAMLMYLDNFSSVGINDAFGNRNFNRAKNKNAGLNENYAREVMELHTLGVDGGYTQNDVTEAARVLTGWTVYPFTDKGPMGKIKKAIEKYHDRLTENGFVHEGDFLFAANRHDTKEKTVLGKKFNAGGGYEEGETLLKMLANHTSTAKFIAKKLAVRFVSDNPPQTLINKMANTFLQTKGNTKQVLLAMVQAPEFWSKEALREKIKSPFELAISTIRILQADVYNPMPLARWITQMGQKVYFYQAPTGFPDNTSFWINTGSLLNRMNFGLSIAANKINGLKVNLAALTNNQEPESAEKALAIYAKKLLPQRDIEPTIKRLQPLLQQTDLINKVNKITDKNKYTNDDDTEEESMDYATKKLVKQDETLTNHYLDNQEMIKHIVGIILGSPEFQRR